MLFRSGDLTDPQTVDMLTFHQTTAHAMTPPGFAFALDLTGLQAPDISFYAAWDGDVLKGIGALRELDAGHGEIKSMHSHREHRGTGVGKAMLAHLIGVARERGYARLSLETGSQDYFTPAHALYACAGFADCGPFGEYRPSPYNKFMSMEL